MERILSKIKRSVRKSASITRNRSSNCDAPLESLPAELRRHLLLTLDLEELWALIRASPVFHQQYRIDRDHILRNALQTTLRSVTVDAHAVYLSSFPSFKQTRDLRTVSEFCEAYLDRRSSYEGADISKPFAPDVVSAMVSFHLRVVLPLSKCYVPWALNHVSELAGSSQSIDPLSKTEEIRLIRAFYRFQLFCNLFGAACQRPQPVNPWFTPYGIVIRYFRLFAPWEVEEIVCIYTFVKEKYSDVFDKISWDVDKRNPKFDGQQSATPEGTFDLENNQTRAGLLTGTISRGLEFLQITLFEVKDHAHLVSTMQGYISWLPASFLGHDTLGRTVQFGGDSFGRRDWKGEGREPLPFKGDDLRTLEEGGPPFAWTRIWGGTYSILFGYFLPVSIHRWGYVLWDAARLERTGASEVLMRQWKECWGDRDPRDDFR